MKRVRRRTVGLIASAAVHAAAFLVLTPVVLMGVRTRIPAADAPAMQVQIVRLHDGLARQAARAPEQTTPPPPSGRQAEPPRPAAQEASPDDQGEPSVVAQNAPLDLDPLWRVPFRDAVAQADAALRAGLGCAHVDLQQLPQPLLDLCAVAAERLKKGQPAMPERRPPPGPDLRA